MQKHLTSQNKLICQVKCNKCCIKAEDRFQLFISLGKSHIQKRRLQHNFICVNLEQSQQVEKSFGKHLHCEVICALTKRFFPTVGVDVIHHQGKIRLSIWNERSALGNDLTNEFVVVLARAFFIRPVWFTKEKGCAFALVVKNRPLYSLDVCKLTTVVCVIPNSG